MSRKGLRFSSERCEWESLCVTHAARGNALLFRGCRSGRVKMTFHYEAGDLRGQEEGCTQGTCTLLTATFLPWDRRVEHIYYLFNAAKVHKRVWDVRGGCSLTENNEASNPFSPQRVPPCGFFLVLIDPEVSNLLTVNQSEFYVQDITVI